MKSRLWLCLAAIFAVFLVPPAMALEELSAERRAYLDELNARAREMRLWEERFWHLLLHYRSDLVGSGYTSDGEGAGFFFAADGKTDPQAELEATLASFYSREPIEPAKMTPQCTFPARFRWLESRLRFDPSRLPRLPCDRFERWRRRIDPESVSLIFSSYYINNPASMFGHTLLRYNKKGRPEDARLLDYAVNYAAAVPPDDGAITFALRGLLGGYQGYFSMMPYYLKVKEYNDVESRDMWEYRLNFSPEQLDYMLMHTWELGSTSFDYYFFKQNCSYHLLTLLEVADPNLRLTDAYGMWTLPADTARQVFEVPGLVSEVIYRPSQSSQLAQKMDDLTPPERALVHRLIESPAAADSAELNALPAPRRALVMDAAINYNQYKLAGGSADDRERKARQRQLLLRRSELTEAGPPPDFAPRTAPPEKGHRSARVGIFGGASRTGGVSADGAGADGGSQRQNQPFAELSIQPLFHDLLSRDEGYAPNSQINLAHLRVRYEEEPEEWRLERFALLDIISLVPFTSLIRQPSWKIAIGWQRNRDIGCEQCTPFFFNPGVGIALASRLHRREVYFALLEGSLEFDREFQSRHRAGFGASAGLLVHLAGWWRIGLFGSWTRYTEGQSGEVGTAALRQRFNLSTNLELHLDWSGVEDYREGLLGLSYYF
ncbi:MAG: DUF4105 domain-containing protein [SAR324 cluster bacterium]|nr:DUF4105 domain-containing protein [SAR324 cluster bacterium]